MPRTHGDGDGGDAAALLGGVSATGAGAANAATPWPTTQQMTWKEACAGDTTRFFHSRTYVAIYLGLAILNAVTLAWAVRVASACGRQSLATICPGHVFMALELGVSLLLFADFVIRLFIAGVESFFSSFSSLLDLVGFVSCILSIYMVALGCNESERVGDIALMFTRIGVQVMRLVLIVRKNRETMVRAETRIDFASVHDHLDEHDLEMDDLMPATLSRSMSPAYPLHSLK